MKTGKKTRKKGEKEKFPPFVFSPSLSGEEVPRHDGNPAIRHAGKDCFFHEAAELPGREWDFVPLPFRKTWKKKINSELFS